MSMEYHFAFLSDPHLNAHDSEKNLAAKRASEAINAATYNGVPKYLWTAITGDLNNAYTGEDKAYLSIWDNWYNRDKPFGMVCEGLGNHDLDSLYFQRVDNLKMILEARNELRKKHSDFVIDKRDGGYKGGHNYKWKHVLQVGNGLTITSHYFMLNLFPGTVRGYSEDPGLLGFEPRGRESFDSLTFLEEQLRTIPQGDPIFLFHHYGFNYALINAADRKEEIYYWTWQEAINYLNVLKGTTEKGTENKLYPNMERIAAIFHGHLHNYQLYALKTYKQLEEKFPQLPIQGICGGATTNQDMVKKNTFISCKVSYEKAKNENQGYENEFAGTITFDVMQSEKTGSGYREKVYPFKGINGEKVEFKAIARKSV